MTEVDSRVELEDAARRPTGGTNGKSVLQHAGGEPSRAGAPGPLGWFGLGGVSCCAGGAPSFVAPESEAVRLMRLDALRSAAGYKRRSALADAYVGDPLGLSSFQISSQCERDETHVDCGGAEGFDAALRDWDERARAIPSAVWFAEKTHHQIHRVQFSAGGTLLRYREAHRAGSQTPPPRSSIMSFSEKSKHALLCFFNSVDREQIDPARLVMFTPTYPAIWPGEWRAWKRHLDLLHQRMIRAFGHLPTIWKLEPQKRGAPHFHLIMLLTSEMALPDGLARFREWCSIHWPAIVAGWGARTRGVKSDDHLKNERVTLHSVELLRSWDKAGYYVAAYLGKPSVFMDQGDHAPGHHAGECMQSGRFWGVWHRDGWPRRLITRTIEQQDWIALRRVVRRYLKKTGMQMKQKGRPPRFQWIGRPRACTAFVPSSIVARVLDERCWWKRQGMIFRDWIKIRERHLRSCELRAELRYHE